MKRIVVFYVLLALLGIPAIVSAEITKNDRMIQKPEWDGAIIQDKWIQGLLGYENYDNDADTTTIGYLETTFATSLKNLPLELGGRLRILNCDIDYDDSRTSDIDETGIGDIDLWGKYQVFGAPRGSLAAGLLITLPTGSDDIPSAAATGEVNLELFLAGRYYVWKDLALIGHLGLRKNSDKKEKVKISGVEHEVKMEGETQFQFTGGALFEVTPKLDLQAGLVYATEAYENGENDFRIRGGATYDLGLNLALKGDLTIGLDDGAPDWGITIGCAYMF